jgi:O-antigen/teichoic acid export membrane protein
VGTVSERLATGTVFVFTFLVVGKLVGIIQSVLLARMLGPRNYGILAILQQILDLAILFAALGLPTAVTKFVSEYRATNNEHVRDPVSAAFPLALVSSLIIGAAFFLAAPALAVGVYGTPELEQYVRIASMSIPFSVFVILSFATLQGYQKIADFSKFNVFLTAVGMVVLVVFTWGFNLYGTSLGITVVSVISFLVGVFLLKRLFGHTRVTFDLPLRMRRKQIGSLLRYSLPLLAASALVLTTHWYARTYLALARGYTDVGLFRVAESLSQLLVFIPSSLSVPFLPVVAEIDAVNPDRMKVAVSKTLKLTSIATLLAGLYIGLPAPFSIMLVLGPRYVNAEVIKALSILLTLAALNSAMVVLGNVLLGSGRTWSYTKILLVLVIPYVILAPIFIDRYGLMGLSLAWFLSYVLYALALIFASRGQLTRGAYKWFLSPLVLLSLYFTTYINWDYSYLLVSMSALGICTFLTLSILLRDDHFVLVIRALLGRTSGRVRTIGEALLNGLLSVLT